RRLYLVWLALRGVCAGALRRGRSRRLPGDCSIPSNAGRVAPHFLWARVRLALAATARNAISKMKTAGCFHSDLATLLRSNPRGGNHRSRDTTECKNIRLEQRAVASRRRNPPDA